MLFRAIPYRTTISISEAISFDKIKRSVDVIYGFSVKRNTYTVRLNFKNTETFEALLYIHTYVR